MSVKKITNSLSIREYRTILRTDSKGQLIHRTEKLNGSLKFILVKTQMVDSVFIVSTVEDKLLVLKSNVSENKIFFPKVRNVDNLGSPLEIMSGHYSEIPLNDSLEIKMNNAQPNSTIEVVIRYA